jgi:pyrroline-5-carboxylate reductase
VFRFIEALEAAAVALDLPPEVARRLALQTFQGAARLAAQSDLPPATLREQVTSKGGTTAAALASMEADRIEPAIVAAVAAAFRRGQQMGDEAGRAP